MAAGSGSCSCSLMGRQKASLYYCDLSLERRHSDVTLELWRLKPAIRLFESLIRLRKLLHTYYTKIVTKWYSYQQMHMPYGIYRLTGVNYICELCLWWSSNKIASENTSIYYQSLFSCTKWKKSMALHITNWCGIIVDKNIKSLDKFQSCIVLVCIIRDESVWSRYIVLV